MSISPGQILIFQAGLKRGKSTYCDLSFNRFAGCFESASLMNEGDPKNCEHWVQIITTIPEISSTYHSHNRTTDKRIISLDSAYPQLLP